MADRTKLGLPPPQAAAEGEPRAEATRAAPTVLGRELHREAGPLAAPLPTPPASPRRSAPAAPRSEWIGRHHRPSRFPAKAHFWGRKNTAGDFESFSVSGDDEPATALVWRRRWVRPLLVVVAAALISFLSVLALIKIREHLRSEEAVPPRVVAW